MAIIHCGFVPHQNIFYKLQLISQRNVSFGKFHNEIIANRYTQIKVTYLDYNRLIQLTLDYENVRFFICILYSV